MMFLVRSVIACLMLLMPLAVPGYAQETTGTILGALVDQTGGVLPGVKVVITSVDTGQTREVVTNNVGQYTASLPIGNYEISFLLPNFQPFTARGISLHVNDRLQVNGKLIVGAVETMTVTAERLVQPTSAVRHLIQPGRRPGAAAPHPHVRPARHARARRVERSPRGGLLLRPGQPRHLHQRGTPQRRQLAAGWRLQCQRLEQLHAGDHAFAGSDPGNQRDHEQLHGRMGPERRGRRQCRDEVRHEQVLGKRVSLSAQRRAQCQLVLPQHGPETRDQQRAARGSATTTSDTRSAARRSRAARSCFSSSHRSGDGAPATKGRCERLGSRSGVADRSRQSQLCPARGA